MSDYTFSQKLLHDLALSSKLIRQTTFDIENFFFNSDISLNSKHVFVTGLARSGTTVLLNHIFRSKQFASLTYRDMPFVLAPNIWSRLNRHKDISKKERAHGDGIFVSMDSPEAFEEIFWKTFTDDDQKVKFPAFVNLVMRRYSKSRYLSKNNNNHQRVLFLRKMFPESRIIIPFRDPSQHSRSLYDQHIMFKKKQANEDFIRKYMDYLGHNEFGEGYQAIHTNTKYNDSNDCNHWLEQWYLYYSKILNELPLINEGVILISYEGLCGDKSVFKSLLSFIEVEDKDISCNFRLSHKKNMFRYDHELLRKSEELHQSLLQSKYCLA